MFEQGAKQMIAQLVQQDFQLLPFQTNGLYLLAKPYHPVLYLVALADGRQWSKEQLAPWMAACTQEMKEWQTAFHCNRSVLLTVLCLPQVTEEEKTHWLSMDFAKMQPEETLHPVFWLMELTTGRYWAPDGHPTRLLHIQDALQQGLLSSQRGQEESSVWQTAEDIWQQSQVKPKEQTAIVTRALLLLLVVLFALFRFIPPFSQQQFWNNSQAVWQQGEYWRWLTALFFHGDFLHLGYNCLSLYIFGSLLERYEGHGFFTLVYFLSGLMGNVLSSIISPPEVYVLGASGAIFGVIGAFFLRAQQEKRQIEGWNYPTLALFVAISLVLGAVSPDVDNWAHLGGCLTGIVLQWIRGQLGKKKEKNRKIE